MPKYHFLWLVFGFLGLPGGAAAQAVDPPDFIVFRHGGTLQGRVVQDGNWYVLRSLSGQGESRYPVQSVLKVCRGPQETYQFLLTKIDPERAEHRCLVARFCVMEGLQKEAESEIQAALRLDRSCSEAKSLLAQLRDKKKTAEVAVPELPVATVEPLPAARLEDWPNIATQNGFVEYTRRVQPILLNGCGTGACHGVSEGKRAFLIQRGLYGAAPSALVSRANLERVLGLIDRERPEESVLLKRALQMHGGAKAAPLVASDQVTYQLLREWVLQCCGEKAIAGKTSTAIQQTSATGFAQQDGEAQAGTASRTAFAATEPGPAAAPPASGIAEAKPALPTIPGISASSAQEAASPVAMPSKNQPTSRLPQIPGLTGRASAQLGQEPPRGVETGPIDKTPAGKVEENPEFQKFSRRMGIVPTIPGPTQEPPRNIQVKNAGSYQVTTPPLPMIPESMNRPPPSKEAEEAANSARFLKSGTIVNPPK